VLPITEQPDGRVAGAAPSGSTSLEARVRPVAVGYVLDRTTSEIPRGMATACVFQEK
jgi:hypothetical protein